METTKDSIDWSHVPDCFSWAARDMNGEAFAYESKPYVSEKYKEMWDSDGSCVFVNYYTSYKQGTCDWRDSLVERPKASEE